MYEYMKQNTLQSGLNAKMTRNARNINSLPLIFAVLFYVLGMIDCDVMLKHHLKKSLTSDIAEGQDHKCKENSSFVWCTPLNYNAEDDPFRYTSLTNITLPWSYDFKFIIKEVSNVNDKAQSISISMYFGVRWFEPRLVINESAEDWTEPKLGPDDHVNVSPETIKDL